MCMQDKVVFISVVRDFEMYDKLVRRNPYNEGAAFTCFDNRISNVGVATRYNSFLDSYDYSEPAWFVFCHEDWELNEDLRPKLSKLNKDSLYGPIGISSVIGGNSIYLYPRGFCRQTSRDGSHEKMNRGLFRSGTVDTFDCQCLIVHSSLVLKRSLRFDDNFTFDLYVEDFCIQAHEKFGIVSRILPLDCRHWSHGNVTERFERLLGRLSDKCSGIYASVVNASIIGERYRAEKFRVVTFRHFPLNHPEKYWLLMKYSRNRFRGEAGAENHIFSPLVQ